MEKLLTLLLLLCLLACQSESQKKTLLPQENSSTIEKQIELITPSGDSIQTTLAITPDEQQQGLSGVQPEDFSDSQSMLFFYLEEGEKAFWMPDTYFDLDIIYVDKDFKIVDIVRKLPHYVGRANPDLIPRARLVWSRHAFEMKSGSEIAKKLKIGDQLQWKSHQTPLQIESKIRQPQ